jgi:ATP-dependent Zn protease
MRNIAFAILPLLILAILCTGCIRIIMPSSNGGENPGGNVEMINEQEALNVAEATISTGFPDMVGIQKTSQSYASQGSEYYEFTYKRMIQVETDTGTFEIPRIVIVTIDKSTGGKSVAVSK